MAFVVFLTYVMVYCVDYDVLFNVKPSLEYKSFWSLIDLGQLGRLSFFPFICLSLFLMFLGFQAFQIVRDYPRLRGMFEFFTVLLEIPDEELSTCDLQVIINKIVKLQEEHRLSVDRLNALDIANRIMRKENYLIAIFNKEVLNLTLPIPFYSSKPLLTKLLEWNLSYCILNYVFDEKFTIRQGFLKDTQRDQLAHGLKKRFFVMGVVNIILSPFILVFLIMYFFLRYGEEIYQNPRSVGTRQYTPYARWKLREFNELPHIFNTRLTNSYRKAKKYMDQFHNDRLAVIARFISFVFGSFLVILAVMTIINEELLLKFELSSGRTVIWYIGLFGVLLAISKSFIPDENSPFEPVQTFNDVAEYTHYIPGHWRNKIHTEQVKNEFGELFQYKLVVLLNEIMGIILTPFVLWFSLPSSSYQIVDFFREFTIHVDGIGYVCSFAVFDFKRHGNPKYGSSFIQTADKYHQSKQGKMEKSFLSFKANFPSWQPDEEGSMYLNKVKEAERAYSPNPVSTPWAFDSFYQSSVQV